MKFKHGTRRRALEYEKDWVQRWKKDGTFKKSVENRPKDDSYVFYDGPPFITGVPHHGTLLSSIVKDAVPRYWTMKGKRVERRWGWDCHGLPAENFVEKQLGIVDRRQIVAKTGDNVKHSLKFTPELTKMIQEGRKTVTFRYEAREFEVGDIIKFYTRYDKSKVEVFGYAKVTQVQKSQLKDISINYKGHETFTSKEEQLETYRGYYDDSVVPESEFTIYDFEYLGENLVQAPLDKDGNELPTISLETYIEKARESMVANSATWEGVIDRIGRWVDFKGAYRTMDKDFMESVWWAFKNLYDAGKIYEGEKVLMYDTKFATPVSKAEVTMDNDAYQTVTDPSVFVKFRVKDDLETDFSDCDVVIVKAGVKKDDKVLWVQEKKETAKHLWNMPGGKVEDGEDLETALRREIDEELGLGIKSLRMTKIHRFEDEHGKIAIILYETELLDGEIELEDKLENYGWFSLEEIEKMFASGEVRGRVEVDQAREILEPSHDKKVLFVCHGCVGRSQMAKALYNHYTQTTNAMAAGTDVAHLNPNASTVRAWEIENNRKSSANELMEDLGLSILDSERHQLTPEMLAEYDLVVNTATKAQTPEWFGGSNIVWWNMKDPGFSHTKDEIKAVRDEIDYRVKELIGGHIIDDTSKGLRELSLNDGEKELEFLRQMPQEENGFGRPAKPEDLVDMGSFRQFLSERVARSRGENIAPGRVPDTTYWVVRGDEIVGMVNIRHYLNDALIANAGGHIGIGGVPTKYRGQGIGSDALGMAVQKLHETGTKDILVGAFEDNIASRRMIEKNGGQLEKVVTSPEHPDRKMAVYWIRERSNSPYILAWTTTPWTLPANLMLAVNPEMTYCEVLVGGEKLIIAEEALERVLKDEKNKPLEYEVLRTFPGSELVGKSYEPLDTGSTWPTDEKTRGKIHKVYAADFVSHESGTGIVHVAPAYGEDDFELAKSMGVAPFHVIDDNGYYTDTNYKGLEVWDNNKFIAKDLKEKGIVWKIEYIRHEYPFNPRSKQRIMYRAIPSWFFDIQGSKPLMLEQNENINWFPPHLKHGRFAKNIEQAPDWNLSRDRFWATAMPVWKGDKGTVKVIGSYAELKELSGVELEDYHRPWVDDVTFTIDGEKFTRIDKVLDGWFESGSMPFAQLHYPFENREKFEENYPADFIVEYVGQVRAWFYYVHAVNTELAALGAFGKDSDRPEKNAFKNVITTGVIAGNDGRKMSKSLGNFTDPNVLMDKFSADSLRFLLLSSPLLNGEDFALHDKDVGDVARKLSMVWNMYDFFTMYAEVDGWEFDSKKPFTLNPDDLTNPLDKWIVSRLHQLNEEVTRNMDGYNIPDALSPVLPFLDDASNWYVRRSRRRFWKSEDDGDKNDAYRTLHYVLLKLSVILAPFTPFLAEELYQNLGGGNESVHLLDWPTNYTVDEKVMSDMTRTRELINTGLGLRMKKDEHQDSIKVRQPLQFASYAGEKLDDYYEQIMIEELNVKEIHHIDSLNEHLENYDEVHGVIDPEAWLEISKKITPELKREGLMREVIRFVQSARKNAGLNVDDRIVLSLIVKPGEADDLGKAIEEHSETIAQEALVAKFADVQDGYDETVKIEGMELCIGLKKL